MSDKSEVHKHLHEACEKLREMASEKGTVCGPCSCCTLEPYYYDEEENQCEDWVEWECGKYKYRATPDGSHVQWRISEKWHSDNCEHDQAAFKKGRETAYSEMDDSLNKLNEKFINVCVERTEYQDKVHRLEKENMRLRTLKGEFDGCLTGGSKCCDAPCEVMTDIQKLREQTFKLKKAITAIPFTGVINVNDWNHVLEAAKEVEL